MLPCPVVHPDHSSFPTFAGADQHRPRVRVQIGLGESERFADPQSGAPRTWLPLRPKLDNAGAGVSLLLRWSAPVSRDRWSSRSESAPRRVARYCMSRTEQQRLRLVLVTGRIR
jgi:hypothetical protein